jgi:hypothetical protein
MNMIKSFTNSILTFIKWYMSNKLYMLSLFTAIITLLFKKDMISTGNVLLMNLTGTLAYTVQILRIYRYNNLYPRYIRFLLVICPINIVWQVCHNLHYNRKLVEENLNLFLKKS